MARRRPYPTHDEIVQAHAQLLETLPNVDPEVAGSTCWACGGCHKEYKPDRAHILASKYGGSNSPDNFFLLCWQCHAEQPDARQRETQIAWLRTHPSQLERVMPLVGRLVKAIEEAARLYGGADALKEFSAYLHDHDIAAIVRNHKRAAAGSSLRQEVSNDYWALLDVFHNWARARCVPAGDQLPLIHMDSDTMH